LDADPTLRDTVGTWAYATVARPGLVEAIGRSIVRWWRLHQRAWNTGVLGRTAQLWSGHLIAKVPEALGGSL
jgi:hypothetical protein